MKHLHNVLNGMASVLSNWSTVRQYPSTDGGFAQDRRMLIADLRQVGANLKKQVTITNDSQSRSSPRRK